ncbi:MAG: DUF4129 domain-containing protein [Candidatus Bathyarchaeia archaeon]
MGAKPKKLLGRLGVVALLVLLATAPLTYPHLASMLKLKSGFGGTVAALDFGSASESASSPDLLLAYAGIASRATAEGNYTEAKRLLEIAGKLPPNIEYNLKTYIALWHDLVLILDSLKPRLDQLQELIADGAVTQARGNSTEIESLTAEASGRLDLLFSSLDRIQTVYGADAGNQRRDLETLSGTLGSFKQLLASLNDQLEEMDGRAETQVNLRVSPNPVQIEEVLQITGEVQSGDAWLAGRTVELLINGVRITDLSLDQLGAFHWQYVVLNGSRTDKLEVYARYSPTGEDVSRFRPAKSTTFTVPVEYQSVMLTSVSSAKRVLVLENFTVQGQLADTLGTPLVGRTVDLLVDGKPVNSSVTDTAGRYNIETSLSAGTPEGGHQLRARFDPKYGIYASSTSEDMPIQLYYLKPAFDQLALTGLAFFRGEVVVISGQTVRLEGRLEVDSKPLPQGLVIASLGDRELAHTLSRADGMFLMSFRVPLEFSDENTVTVVFVPVKPWVAGITASIVLRVLNSVVIGLATGATVFAAMVFSGTSIDPRRMMRRRAIGRELLETEMVTVGESEVKEKAGPAPGRFPLSDLKLELELESKFAEPRVFVNTAYWEIRRMLAETLDVRGELSETPREFQTRVGDRVGVAASSLLALTQLFELAEYSQHAVSRLEAQEAANHALPLVEAMKEKIKR